MSISLRLILCLLMSLLTLQAQQAPPSASSRTSSHAKATVPDAGQFANGIYRNAFFGFSYKLPFGWVDRSQDMREDSGDEDKPVDRSKSLVLLATFERPPEAKGETVNSSVVIAAESVAAYPGLKSAAQYFGPLNEVTTKQDLKALNEPYEFPVDARPIVRCDYAGPRGSMTLHQSTLALLAKGYVVSFTFIGGNDDEVTALLGGLNFAKVTGPAHP